MTEKVVSPLLEDLHVRLESAERRRHAGGRPFVTLAYAQSLDGSIAGEGNRPLRLSCRSSLLLTHELRAAHDAILVGIGTVLADDPRLNVRLVNGCDPRPVVVDSRLRIPREAHLLEGGRGALIAATKGASRARGELESLGAEIVSLPALPNGWVDLGALLGELGKRGIAHVLVEGGGRILTSFLESRTVDYVVLTLSLRFVAGVRATASELSSHPRLAAWRSERIGEDLVVAGELVWPGG